MQTTYHLNAENLNSKFLEAVKSVFGKKNIKIIIEDGVTEQAIDQKELFQSMEELRLSMGHVEVDPNLDLSALANEVNDTRL